MAIADQGVKMSQSDARYRAGNSEQSCANCMNYLQPDTCATVAGRVSASGLCDFWEQMKPEALGPSPEMAMAQLFSPGGMPNG